MYKFIKKCLQTNIGPELIFGGLRFLQPRQGLRGIPFMDCLDTVGYMGDDGGNRNLGEGHSVDSFAGHCCLGIVHLLSLPGIRKCGKQGGQVDCGSDVLRCYFV
jgi:hypothetical protein